jgi:hypothetical protein
MEPANMTTAANTIRERKLFMTKLLVFFEARTHVQAPAVWWKLMVCAPCHLDCRGNGNRKPLTQPGAIEALRPTIAPA